MLNRGTLPVHYEWVRVRRRVGSIVLAGFGSVGRAGPGIPTLLLNKQMVAGGRGWLCVAGAASANSPSSRRARAAHRGRSTFVERYAATTIREGGHLPGVMITGLTSAVQALRHAMAAAAARLMPHRRLHGIVVVDYGATSESASYFERLEQALALIARHDPRRMRRIQRDLKRIGVVRSGGEVYDHGIGTYLAIGSLLHLRSLEEIALTIVHEATHARLRRAGVVTTPGIQERVERLCVSQEVAFAQRLPNGDVLAVAAEAKLQTPWWGTEAMTKRYEDQLRGYGIPEWLIRLRLRLLQWI